MVKRTFEGDMVVYTNNWRGPTMVDTIVKWTLIGGGICFFLWAFKAHEFISYLAS